MRSHAKAVTAGSTMRQATGLGHILRGAFARRDGSPRVGGSSAPMARVLGLALIVAMFCTAFAASSALAAAPIIPVTTVSAVTTSTGVLEAEVNPEGEATSYQFNYGLADCLTNPCSSVPASPAGIGSGTAGVKVAKEISGLKAGTTYHFRLVASNGSGTVEGPDRTFTTYEPFVPQTNCPNQDVRYGFSANLPNCRAYEMVSPIDKDGGEVVGPTSFPELENLYMRSSVGGDKFTYSSFKSWGDQKSPAFTSQYLTARGPGGWVTHGINPIQTSPTIFGPGVHPFMFDIDYQAFTPDLASAWVVNFNKVPLTPDALAGYLNLFRRDNVESTFEPLTTADAGPFAPAPVYLGSPRFKGASTDLSHQVFQAEAALTSDAVSGGRQIYDLHEGELELVNILPEGEVATSSAVGTNIAQEIGREGTVDHAVSNDGSRIFWTDDKGAPTQGGEVFVRVDGQETIRVSPPGSQAFFWTASADGSKAIFSTGNGFSGEATLYQFDVDTKATTEIAGESYGVAGAGDDASHVYFVSKEVLDAGATAGEPNLYLYREGGHRFIATVALDDVAGYNAKSLGYSITSLLPLTRATRVTPDGHGIAFNSVASLTGYDNTDAKSGKPDVEVYVYDSDGDELTCVSCNPSGARPRGQRMYRPYQIRRDQFISTSWAAAWIPTWEWELYDSRVLSNDGNRIFFNSFDSLVPGDTNAVQDVYQWEAEGSGTCDKDGGCISLISSGTSPTWSEFADATPSGDDVFFRTASSLDPEDPGLIDLYDARVGGGYQRPMPPTPCVGDACQSPPPAPGAPTPASASFHGAGDPVAPKKARRCKKQRRRAAKRASKSATRAKCMRAKRRASQ